MHWWLISVLSLFAILSSTCPLFAATGVQFDSWTTENGLPQNSILDIVQTRDGYIWFGTEGGLARFDGVRFVVFDRTARCGPPAETVADKSGGGGVRS